MSHGTPGRWVVWVCLSLICIASVVVLIWPSISQCVRQGTQEFALHQGHNTVRVRLMPGDYATSVCAQAGAAPGRYELACVASDGDSELAREAGAFTKEADEPLLSIWFTVPQGGWPFSRKSITIVTSVEVIEGQDDLYLRITAAK